MISLRQSEVLSSLSVPWACKFYAKYIPFKSGNGDFGTAEIIVRDASGNILAQRLENIQETNGYVLINMPLTYNYPSVKAAN